MNSVVEFFCFGIFVDIKMVEFGDGIFGFVNFKFCFCYCGVNIFDCVGYSIGVGNDLFVVGYKFVRVNVCGDVESVNVDC